MHRLRRSTTLVLLFEASGVVGHDYFTGQRAELSPTALRALAELADWQPLERLFDGGGDRRARAAELVRLVDLGFLVVEGTAAAATDERLRLEWKWGPGAGHYHFGIKDPDYQGPQAAFRWLAHQVVTEPDPPLYATHDGRDDVIPLPAPDLDGGLLGFMARRRSYRGFDRAGWLPLEALRDCLFAGMGITAFADAGIAGHAPLPLAMTPSGGARNPYEAYVVVTRVSGLLPGVYHYAGIDNTLVPIAAPPASLAALVGNQEWFDHAAALVLLVASFSRCMWKYTHPTGYRVVILEAGHIAQNMLLAATAHGLAAAPTCAVSDRDAEALLGLDRVHQAVIHTVALGVRSDQPTIADVSGVRPNPRLRR